jgi:hypothetical protein
MFNHLLNTILVDAVITGIAAGVIGTIAMDLLNFLFARFRIITIIDISMIGRMAAGWVRGRFFYESPTEIKEIKNDKLFGFLAHYAIGICLALPYVSIWYIFVELPFSPTWAIVYGILTTVGSWFFIFPSMGLGICGLKSPEKLKATFSSLANHLFYGIGMAIGIALI